MDSTTHSFMMMKWGRCIPFLFAGIALNLWRMLVCYFFFFFFLFLPQTCCLGEYIQWNGFPVVGRWRQPLLTCGEIVQTTRSCCPSEKVSVLHLLLCFSLLAIDVKIRARKRRCKRRNKEEQLVRKEKKETGDSIKLCLFERGHRERLRKTHTHRGREIEKE